MTANNDTTAPGGVGGTRGRGAAQEGAEGASGAAVPHCATCRCGRWAPVNGRDGRGLVVGWAEHAEAWADYAKRYGREQDAERIAERGGFSLRELREHLGREPQTVRPMARGERS